MAFQTRSEWKTFQKFDCLVDRVFISEWVTLSTKLDFLSRIVSEWYDCHFLLTESQVCVDDLLDSKVFTNLFFKKRVLNENATSKQEKKTHYRSKYEIL